MSTQLLCFLFCYKMSKINNSLLDILPLDIIYIIGNMMKTFNKIDINKYNISSGHEIIIDNEDNIIIAYKNAYSTILKINPKNKQKNTIVIRNYFNNIHLFYNGIISLNTKDSINFGNIRDDYVNCDNYDKNGISFVDYNNKTNTIFTCCSSRICASESNKNCIIVRTYGKCNNCKKMPFRKITWNNYEIIKNENINLIKYKMNTFKIEGNILISSSLPLKTYKILDKLYDLNSSHIYKIVIDKNNNYILYIYTYCLKKIILSNNLILIQEKIHILSHIQSEMFIIEQIHKSNNYKIIDSLHENPKYLTKKFRQIYPLTDSFIVDNHRIIFYYNGYIWIQYFFI